MGGGYKMGSSIPFDQKVAQYKQQLMFRESLKQEGRRELADKLAKAREQDALELFGQARTSISGLAEEDKVRTMCVLACNKLFDVGYREFAGLFKQVLEQSGK